MTKILYGLAFADLSLPQDRTEPSDGSVLTEQALEMAVERC
jgi:hypothetical protein